MRASTERKVQKFDPTLSVRDQAVVEAAWDAVTSAQVLPRTVDADEGVRAIVYLAGASWIHGAETAFRLQRIFPGLPEREQRLMIRHIDARIIARAAEKGLVTHRRNWVTGWMRDGQSKEFF